MSSEKIDLIIIGILWLFINFSLWSIIPNYRGSTFNLIFKQLIINMIIFLMLLVRFKFTIIIKNE